MNCGMVRAFALVAALFLACVSNGQHDEPGSDLSVVDSTTRDNPPDHGTTDVSVRDVVDVADLPGNPFDSIGAFHDAHADALVPADSGVPGADSEILALCEVPAAPGCECQQDDECIFGLCLDGENDRACAGACDEEDVACRAAFAITCTGNWAFQKVDRDGSSRWECLPLHPRLCRPCMRDADCDMLVPSTCVVFGDSGSYCATRCNDAAPCPQSFECQASSGGMPGVDRVCLPEAGTCACSSRSATDGAVTGCNLRNEHGTCPGTRRCGPGGLSDCDARVPAAEACNGVDDNCDGLTDPPGTCAPIVVRKVCLDPGHGGTDPGAVGFVHEAPMNLDIGLRLRDLLAGDTRDASGGASWGVFMTRDSDSAVSLESRVDYANASQVDRFVSIHNNAGGGTGTETYWYTSGSAQSGNLAGKVQARVVSYVGTRDRGVKQAGYYVIRYTVMPAVLVEVAFVDTRSDADILEDPVRRQAAARGMLHGLQEHFGVPVHDPVQDLPQRGPS